MQSPNSALQWHSVEELIDAAMSAADIVGLGRWAGINHRFCSLVQGVLQRRMKNIVGQFIGTPNLLEFFGILDKTDSAIGGSVALWVITLQCDWQPQDINIMVPRNARERWLAFFEHHEY